MLKSIYLQIEHRITKLCFSGKGPCDYLHQESIGLYKNVDPWDASVTPESGSHHRRPSFNKLSRFRKL